MTLYVIGVTKTEIVESVAYHTIQAESVEMASEMVLSGLTNNKSNKPEWSLRNKTIKGYSLESHGLGVHSTKYSLKNWKPAKPNTWVCLR